MTEHQKAKAWRESRGFSVAELADLTGYSAKAIYWFERGETPPLRNNKGEYAHDRRHKEWVWQRYRMACAGVQAELNGRAFKWEI